MESGLKESGWVVHVKLDPPAAGDNTADAERLNQALCALLQVESVHIGLYVLQKLPQLIRDYAYNLRCILFPQGNTWLLLGIMPASSKVPVAGLALDLGTSKCALRLVDLLTGTTWAETNFDNPQMSVGADILTRIHLADKSGGLKELQDLIIHKINIIVQELANTANIGLSDIYLFAVAGNTAMTHLFLGLIPYWMIREPYIPAVNSPGPVRAVELGIKLNPEARVFVFPNVGSYFGGDVLAGLLYCGLGEQEELSLLVDVGTNAEVCLGNAHWLLCCAGAAGPALESGASSLGMMAAPGVIDSAYIDPQSKELALHVLGEGRPCGICGSGLLDLAGELFLNGMLDSKGQLRADRCGWRYQSREGIGHFVLVKAEDSATGQDLSISQIELDSLIRAKAAMYAILETAAAAVGVALQEVQKFYVAGTFGNYIRPQSAIALGMLPDLPLKRFIVLGNSSLEGATSLLCLRAKFYKLQELKDMITYLELNVNQEFMQRFNAARFLPHTEAGLFPSVHQRSSANSQCYNFQQG